MLIAELVRVVHTMNDIISLDSEHLQIGLIGWLYKHKHPSLQNPNNIQNVFIFLYLNMCKYSKLKTCRYFYLKMCKYFHLKMCTHIYIYYWYTIVYIQYKNVTNIYKLNYKLQIARQISMKNYPLTGRPVIEPAMNVKLVLVVANKRKDRDKSFFLLGLSIKESMQMTCL